METERYAGSEVVGHSFHTGETFGTLLTGAVVRIRVSECQTPQACAKDEHSRGEVLVPDGCVCRVCVAVDEWGVEISCGPRMMVGIWESVPVI